MNLYNKYRSQKFDEVVGQKQIVTVLKNALVYDKVAHAYLFSGPRGTGKTTLARLLAKSLNCLNRKKDHYEPCNKCASCQEITQGTSMDIIEIDAASNRGIDEMRSLRDKIRFAASGKKHKVFIIDEVHMLTREAFNALLKTLEEPPSHVVFILATTELHKVPETIISRSQSFAFSLHSLPDIAAQLEKIAKTEKINIDKASIELIAEQASGGMRDAITLLDQIAVSAKKITEEQTRKILGLSGKKTIIKFIKLLANHKTNDLLEMIGNIYAKGIDLYQFIYEILECLRRILLVKNNYLKAINLYAEDEKKEVMALVEQIAPKEILSYLERILKAHQETKNAEITQLPLEMAVIEICRMENVESSKKNEVSSKEKVDKKNIKSAGWRRNSKLETRNTKQIINSNDKNIKSEKLTAESRKSAISIIQIQEKWPGIVSALSAEKMLSTIIKSSKAREIVGDRLIIAVQFGFHKDKLENKKIYELLAKTVADKTGEPLALGFVVDKTLESELPASNISNANDDGGLLGEAMEVFG